MKGGTAINLFVQDLPRLSVDIDVVYLPHQKPREAAMAEIATELNAIRDRLQRRGLAAEVMATSVGDETKIFVRRGRDQVKVEINHVFRGAVLLPETRPLVKAASDLFTVGFSVPTLAVPELYGSKLVAALDRQHPRDLFDVHGMFQTHEIQPLNGLPNNFPTVNPYYFASRRHQWTTTVAGIDSRIYLYHFNFNAILPLATNQSCPWCRGVNMGLATQGMPPTR
jgi:hypothetical protein